MKYIYKLPSYNLLEARSGVQVEVITDYEYTHLQQQEA